MDFDWPIKKVWKGYLNPHEVPECGACEGTVVAGNRMSRDKWLRGFLNDTTDVDSMLIVSGVPDHRVGDSHG
jgi:hypothetical protein